MKSFLNTCALYGAGLNAHGILRYIGYTNISNIIDSFNDRIGKEFEGFYTIGIEDFLKKDSGEPIIVSAYQKAEEVIRNLKKIGYSNYLIAPYLQSSVTEIDEIADLVLEHAKERHLVFDNSLNMLVPMLLDEFDKRGKLDMVLGFLNNDNNFVLQHYGKRVVDAVGENIYVIKTGIDDENKEIYKSNSINICNLMYYNPHYQNQDLAKFKNLYKNKRCFIIGNGPSLKMEDLDLLHNRREICFGSNGIFHAYKNTKWRPDYYVITDFLRYKENYKVINELNEKNIFIRRFYNMEGMQYPIGANIYNSPPQRSDFEFSDDITKAVFSGMTVTYNMLQIAAYMGFDKIYLLGVDFSFSSTPNSGTNHFDSNYEKSSSVKDIFYRDENLAAFMSAEKYARNHGFRIFNATRGGMLEVFERVSFDSLFKSEVKDNEENSSNYADKDE